LKDKEKRRLQATSAAANGTAIAPIKSSFDKEAVNARNQVIAGFFYLSNNSVLQLSSTKLVNTEGSGASAIYATSGSSVSVINISVNGVQGPDGCKLQNSGVIVGELALSIKMQDSNFSDNTCS